LNIVCFRYRKAQANDAELDALNEAIVEDLQEAGIAAPSTTRLRGRLAIRVNITNHRTRREDLDLLLRSVLETGRRH
jgi:aromatic-L-amino-acid decarboxylase